MDIINYLKYNMNKEIEIIFSDDFLIVRKINENNIGKLIILISFSNGFFIKC